MKPGRRFRLAVVALLAAPGLVARAAESVVAVKAIDPNGAVVANVRFTYAGVESPPTTSAGITEVRIVLGTAQKLPPGSALELDLPSGVAATWFLIDDTVHVPAPGQPPAEVVLLRRADMRRLAAEVRDAPVPARELSADEKQRIVLEYAGRYGLSQENLDTAISRFRETAEDPLDQGVALFLSREYSLAESHFRTAVEQAEVRRQMAERERLAAERDLVEAARYLGQTLYEQARYEDAAQTFRKVLALRPDDSDLMRWLGDCLVELAAWAEAEPWLRRALALSEASRGPEHADVSLPLNSLGALLQWTNRHAEAEPLLRRALAIGEVSFGPGHSGLAISLTNLALLLRTTDRLAEAEPLLRRAGARP